MTFEEAKELIKNSIQEDGSLFEGDLGYLYWSGDDSNNIVLDGEYSATELLAIVTYVNGFKSGETIDK